MKKITILIIILATLVFSQSTMINTRKFSLKLSSGIIHYPLTEWKDFFSGFENYEQDKVNIFGAIRLNYQLDFEGSSVFFESEYLTTNAYEKYSTSELNWQFQGVPVTLGYQYNLLGFSNNVEPFVSFGISYFFSKLTAELKFTPETPPYNINSKSYREGEGYGYFGEIGFDYKLKDSMFLSLSYKIRSADGMYFSDNEGDVPVEFSSHSANLGFGYVFR